MRTTLREERRETRLPRKYKVSAAALGSPARAKIPAPTTHIFIPGGAINRHNDSSR